MKTICHLCLGLIGRSGSELITDHHESSRIITNHLTHTQHTHNTHTTHTQHTQHTHPKHTHTQQTHNKHTTNTQHTHTTQHKHNTNTTNTHVKHTTHTQHTHNTTQMNPETVPWPRSPGILKFSFFRPMVKTLCQRQALPLPAIELLLLVLHDVCLCEDDSFSAGYCSSIQR